MKKLFEFLKDNSITPNGLYILHSIYNEYFLDRYINVQHERHRLALIGFLNQSIKNDKVTYTLTQKGLHIIRESEKLMLKVPKATKVSKIPFEDWKENIIKYNELFPKGKKQGSSISFRTNPKELFGRFKWFFIEYPEYGWEMIFKATKLYLKHYEDENDFTYTQVSKYFIKKDDKNKTTTSNLATMCYNIEQGNEDEIDNGSFYFGPQ